MRRRNFAQNTLEEPAINLTPLIDVVFVILIMFILIAPILDLDRIQLADSPSNKKDPSISVQAQSPISIYVHKDNRITFNERTVKLEQISGLLKKAKSKYPNVRPQIFHDRRGHFGTYQAIKNAAEDAGFQQLDIVLNP